MNTYVITKDNKHYFNRNECENVEYNLVNSQLLIFEADFIEEGYACFEITNPEKLNQIEDKYIKTRKNISLKNYFCHFFNRKQYIKEEKYIPEDTTFIYKERAHKRIQTTEFTIIQKI